MQELKEQSLIDQLESFLQDIASEFRGNPVGIHRVNKAQELLKLTKHIKSKINMESVEQKAKVYADDEDIFEEEYDAFLAGSRYVNSWLGLDYSYLNELQQEIKKSDDSDDLHKLDGY